MRGLWIAAMLAAAIPATPAELLGVFKTPI
jgi:hypothetical protein